MDGDRLSGGTLRIHAASGDAWLLISVTPVPRLPAGSVWNGDRLALLLLSAPHVPAPGLASRLSEAFRLSPAEIRVVTALAAGQTRAEIAALENVSTETVATHVKRSLAKTGTPHQRALLSLVVSL